MVKPIEIFLQKKEQALDKIQNNTYLFDKLIYVGMATCEIAAGSKEVMEIFKNALQKGLVNAYLAFRGCVGMCSVEPTVDIIEKGKINVRYGFKIKKVNLREKKIEIVVDGCVNYNVLKFDETYNTIIIESISENQSIWPNSKIWHRKNFGVKIQ